MERFLLRQNIAIFKRALETETDVVTCGILWQLLADAEVKLARLDALADDPPGLAAFAQTENLRG